MQFPRLLAAVLALSAAAGAAQGATGSGTVSFTFTGFEGPFAMSDVANIGDPSQWILTGLVNGATPTLNGVTSPTGVPNLAYLGGTAPLSGQSAVMFYANGAGIASVVSFTPAPLFSNVSTGQAFLLGTLAFTNGQWVGGSGDPATNYPVDLGFTLTTTSSTPEFNQSISDTIRVVTNQATPDCEERPNPQAEADFLYLKSAPQLGSMRVYDAACRPPGGTNFGSVELWGRFGSLHYVDFRNPAGSAFLSDSVDVGGQGVPEPSAWALMLAGFGLAGTALRRGRRVLRPA